MCKNVGHVPWIFRAVVYFATRMQMHSFSCVSEIIVRCSLFAIRMRKIGLIDTSSIAKRYNRLTNECTVIQVPLKAADMTDILTVFDSKCRRKDFLALHKLVFLGSLYSLIFERW